MIMEWHPGEHIVTVYRNEPRLTEPVPIPLSPL